MIDYGKKDLEIKTKGELINIILELQNDAFNSWCEENERD